MDKEQFGVIETAVKPTAKLKYTYTTFFNFSFVTFLRYRSATVFLLLLVAIFGVMVHTWWSLAASVLAIARCLRELAMLSKTVDDIRYGLNGQGIETGALLDYLKANGSMTLRTVEKIDEGAAERGDTEG